MRFSTAAIVASAAVGHVAAGPTHHRHQALHAAREASAEPGWQDVDFSNKDLYKDVNWSSVFGQGGASSTGAAAPVATTTKTQPTGNSQPVVNSQPSGSSQQQQPSQTHSSSSSQPSSGSSNPVNAVSNLVSNGAGALVSSLFNNAGGLKIAAPVNPGFSLGQGTYTINAKNNKQGDMHLVCWVFSNYDSSMVGAGMNAPGCNIKIPAQQTQAVTIPEGKSGACAPVWDDTKPAHGVGYIWNTWLEWTMSPTGVVDVSYEPNMGGDSIVATVKESGCSSSKASCGFTCLHIEVPELQNCMGLGNYTLNDCKGQPGANTDNVKQNGGCGWPGHNSATIDAVFG